MMKISTIKVLTPDYSSFNYLECKKLYDKYRNLICDDEFDDVINRTQFFAFHIAVTNELIGCLYYYLNDEKLFVNGFANRHHHQLNVECLKESLKWFDKPIYSKTKHKTATLCLLKSGFKFLNENENSEKVYIYN